MKVAKIVFVILTVLLVIGGQVGLWLSDEYPAAAKTKLTVLNVLGWMVILLPAIAVSKWAQAHARDRNEQS